MSLVLLSAQGRLRGQSKLPGRAASSSSPKQPLGRVCQLCSSQCNTFKKAVPLLAFSTHVAIHFKHESLHFQLSHLWLELMLSCCTWRTNTRPVQANISPVSSLSSATGSCHFALHRCALLGYQRGKRISCPSCSQFFILDVSAGSPVNRNQQSSARITFTARVSVSVTPSINCYSVPGK